MILSIGNNFDIETDFFESLCSLYDEPNIMNNESEIFSLFFRNISENETIIALLIVFKKYSTNLLSTFIETIKLKRLTSKEFTSCFEGTERQIKR